MVRVAVVMLAGLVLAPSARAAEAPPAGNWKMTLPLMEGGGARPLWLLHFEQKDGKWTGKMLARAERIPEATLENVRVDQGRLLFGLKLPEATFQFEGKLPGADGKTIRGSVVLRTSASPAELERTTLTSLAPAAVNREVLATHAEGYRVVQAALSLIAQAGAENAKPEEVRSWAARAAKAAAAYGPRWQRDVLVTVSELLGRQKGYESVALPYARQAERLLTAQDQPRARKRVLDALASALEKAGKTDEAKEVRGRAEKIDFSVKARQHPGRKGKEGRAVLVELFSGAQCPPCVAADLAFDALDKTFKPEEVVLLQYALHVPSSDPLATPASAARAKFYSRAVEGTPTILFNGKPGAEGGGGADAAGEKYEEYVTAVAAVLEKPAGAAIKARARRKGDQVQVRAEVSDLKTPGDDVRLRLALVEKQIDYTGRNRLAHHHHVVRGFVGGADGLPLKEKMVKKTATLDLGELRKEIQTALDKQAKEEPIFGKRPALDLKGLYVVAFVQNDKTGEVLQAVRVPLQGEE